jgi:NADH-quinone oxidoreductase subunit J
VSWSGRALNDGKCHEILGRHIFSLGAPHARDYRLRARYQEGERDGMSEAVAAVVFFLFAGLGVSGALGVVMLRNPVHCALSLAVVFVSLAVMYILLSAPFIAAAQVMIYAGAILILFLFVIMVLNPRLEIGDTLTGQRPAAIAVGIALAIVVSLVLVNGRLAPALGPFTPEYIAQKGHTQLIGSLLFTDFLLPFEITSLLLLVAIVGVISLAKKT